jgi:hypothetical protein
MRAICIAKSTVHTLLHRMQGCKSTSTAQRNASPSNVRYSNALRDDKIDFSPRRRKTCAPAEIFFSYRRLFLQWTDIFTELEQNCTDSRMAISDSVLIVKRTALAVWGWLQITMTREWEKSWFGNRQCRRMHSKTQSSRMDSRAREEIKANRQTRARTIENSGRSSDLAETKVQLTPKDWRFGISQAIAKCYIQTTQSYKTKCSAQIQAAPKLHDVSNDVSPYPIVLLRTRHVTKLIRAGFRGAV